MLKYVITNKIDKLENLCLSPIKNSNSEKDEKGKTINFSRNEEKKDYKVKAQTNPQISAEAKVKASDYYLCASNIPDNPNRTQNNKTSSMVLNKSFKNRNKNNIDSDLAERGLIKNLGIRDFLKLCAYKNQTSKMNLQETKDVISFEENYRSKSMNNHSSEADKRDIQEPLNNFTYARNSENLEDIGPVDKTKSLKLGSFDNKENPYVKNMRKEKDFFLSKNTNPIYSKHDVNDCDNNNQTIIQVHLKPENFRDNEIASKNNLYSFDDHKYIELTKDEKKRSKNLEKENSTKHVNNLKEKGLFDESNRDYTIFNEESYQRSKYASSK